MENPDNLAYKIAISLIPGIGSVTARNLIAYIGSVEGVFQEKEKNLMKIPGIGEVNAKRVVRQNVLDRAKREVDFILKNKIQTFFYLDDNYPTRLKGCSDSPIILYFKGNANLNEQRIISVVGTRSATNYGKEICEELIRSFSEKSYPILVVSGLAYGIDVHAHKACLKYSIPTVGVFCPWIGYNLPIAARPNCQQNARKRRSDVLILSAKPKSTGKISFAVTGLLLACQMPPLL